MAWREYRDPVEVDPRAKMSDYDHYCSALNSEHALGLASLSSMLVEYKCNHGLKSQALWKCEHWNFVACSVTSSSAVRDCVVALSCARIGKVALVAASDSF